jgi:hypothetical protein
MADEDLGIFESSVGRFFDEHATPEDTARWRARCPSSGAALAATIAMR